MSASLENAGVCILSATAPQPQVDAAGLRAKGLRVRTVSTCVADVLLASASLAMLVIPSADLHPGTAGAERQWDRVLSLSQKGFRSALVIVHGPSSPQLQQRIVSETSKFLGKPAFMEVLSSAALTDFVLDVIQSSVGETCDGMMEQKALTAASPAAVVHALMGIPEAHISEPQAQAMRMLGSMQDILLSTADDLMYCADLSRTQAAAVDCLMAQT